MGACLKISTPSKRFQQHWVEIISSNKELLSVTNFQNAKFCSQPSDEHLRACYAARLPVWQWTCNRSYLLTYLMHSLSLAQNIF